MLRKNNSVHYVSYHAETWYVESSPYQQVFPIVLSKRNNSVAGPASPTVRKLPPTQSARNNPIVGADSISARIFPQTHQTAIIQL